ncbi:hypothetical protein HK096_001629, partial [Nowakowskiella sp. JEL0078]
LLLSSMNLQFTYLCYLVMNLELPLFLYSSPTNFLLNLYHLTLSTPWSEETDDFLTTPLEDRSSLLLLKYIQLSNLSRPISTWDIHLLLN